MNFREHGIHFISGARDEQMSLLPAEWLPSMLSNYDEAGSNLRPLDMFYL
jgi:hypothetical protein